MEEHDGGRPGRLGVRDPWAGALAVGPWEQPPPEPGPPARSSAAAVADAGAAERAAVYREVQEGEAFQAVRRRYRRFAFPASVGFFVWYLAYVVAATTAPGLMARPVVGPVNVAMVAGLAQFVTTFALTGAYAWHARRYRDRAALDLRWDTQERTR